MKKNNLLLVIDMQNDFCLPTGTLYVPGAENDSERLTSFIQQNTASIDEIILTQDNHHVLDISHPAFWYDKDGNNPEPFTQITMEDVRNQKWIPRFFASEATNYIEKLYDQGEFPHVVWPEHCIVGSKGAAITDNLMGVVKSWAREGNYYQMITKGLYPLTEHFGALRANIPSLEQPETQLNNELVEKLTTYKNIFIAGEAKSHCVANTVKQLCELTGIANKIILLEDTMSNVTGFEEIAVPIYERALKLGARFEKAEGLILK